MPWTLPIIKYDITKIHNLHEANPQKDATAQADKRKIDTKNHGKLVFISYNPYALF